MYSSRHTNRDIDPLTKAAEKIKLIFCEQWLRTEEHKLL